MKSKNQKSIAKIKKSKHFDKAQIPVSQHVKIKGGFIGVEEGEM